MLQCDTAVGFISSPGIGLCGSCSLYYCSQTFFEAWPVESRTKSAGAKVLRVDFGRRRVLKITLFWYCCSLLLHHTEKQQISVLSPDSKKFDLLFGASYRRRTQGLDMKTSVSEPWCRSARLDMNHDGTPSGSGAQVLTPTQVKDKKLGHVFAHVWAEIQEYVFKAKTGTGLSNCFDGVQTPKQPKHENYLITSSGRQQDFFSSFITYFFDILSDDGWDNWVQQQERKN